MYPRFVARKGHAGAWCLMEKVGCKMFQRAQVTARVCTASTPEDVMKSFAVSLRAGDKSLATVLAEALVQ